MPRTAQQLRDDALAIWHAGLAGEFAQKTDAQRMKGSDQGKSAAFRDERMHPFAHLASRLIGKRDRKEVVRGHALLNKVRDPMCDGLRLPRSRAGDDQKRPLPMQSRLRLPLIQSFEVFHLRNVA